MGPASRRLFLLAAECGMKRWERVEILCSAGSGLATYDVLEGGDHHVQAIAERLAMGGATEVLVAVGAVGACGDVDVARVGGEVPDLGSGEYARVDGEGNWRLVGHSDARVQLFECRGEPLEVRGFECRGDVEVAGEYPGARA